MGMNIKAMKDRKLDFELGQLLGYPAYFCVIYPDSIPEFSTDPDAMRILEQSLTPEVQKTYLHNLGTQNAASCTTCQRAEAMLMTIKDELKIIEERKLQGSDNGLKSSGERKPPLQSSDIVMS